MVINQKQVRSMISLIFQISIIAKNTRSKWKEKNMLRLWGGKRKNSRIQCSPKDMSSMDMTISTHLSQNTILRNKAKSHFRESHHLDNPNTKLKSTQLQTMRHWEGGKNTIINLNNKWSLLAPKSSFPVKSSSTQLTLTKLRLLTLTNHRQATNLMNRAITVKNSCLTINNSNRDEWRAKEQ